jgi:hypothetical protein
MVVFAIWFALTAAEAYLWAFRGPVAGPPYVPWYNLVSTLSSAAGVAAMAVLLIALYRHLLQPRLVPDRPMAGFAIALLGALLSLVPVTFTFPGGTPEYFAAISVSFFSLPTFLLGLGLMFFWGSPPGPAPVTLAPQPAPPAPVTRGNSEITTGPWSPP